MYKLCTKCSLPLTAENSIPATGAKASSSGIRPSCKSCTYGARKAQRQAASFNAQASAVGSLIKHALPTAPVLTPQVPSFSLPHFSAPEALHPSSVPEPLPVSGTPHAPPARGALGSETPSPLRQSGPPVPPASATLERFAIIPDVHHNESHPDYRVMLRALDVFQPEGILVLGDFADAESLSAHPKTQRGADDFKAEVDGVNSELDILDRLPRLKWKKYIEGNHEWRLQRYLANNAQALMGMLDIKSCLRLFERGWEFTPYMHHTRVGKVHFTHDTGQAGVNAHRSARDIFMGSAVIGHTHRMAYEVRGVWGGPPVVTAMFGWLGNPEKITYVHQAAAAMWPRGFGIGYHDTVSGLVYLVPVPIVNGTCVVEGRLVK